MLELDSALELGELRLCVALAVADGETLALTGPSGAGKTSVLRVVAGLLEPRRGRVACGGELWLDTARGVALPPERRRCGYLFQTHALFPNLRGWENVAYGMRDLPRRERRRRAHELLERFGVLALADARPRTWSGGERQRVALARALARRPRVLLLDEPLAALDVRSRGSAGRELAAALRAAGVPALLVTHSFEEAALLGDRIGVLDGGRIVQEGGAAELTAAPASAFVADLTGAVVLTGVARPGGDGLTHVALEGGGEIASTDRAEGPVGATVHPWEIALEPPGAGAQGSPRNRVAGEVASVTRLGNRVRVGVLGPQPLTAELTEPGAEALALEPGAAVVASFKATATRLVPR